MQVGARRGLLEEGTLSVLVIPSDIDFGFVLDYVLLLKQANRVVSRVRSIPRQVGKGGHSLGHIPAGCSLATQAGWSIVNINAEGT